MVYLVFAEKMSHIGTMIHLAQALRENDLARQLMDTMDRLENDSIWEKLGYVPPEDAGALDLIDRMTPEDLEGWTQMYRKILIDRLRKNVWPQE